MTIFKLGPAWGLAGFVLGVALSGAVGSAWKSSPANPLAPQSSVSVNADASNATFPQRVVLTVVANDELETAIQSFAIGAQPKIRQDVTSGKYGLLWITAWDWDTAPGEEPNTISILSNDYRRYIQLGARRARYAVPDPRSGSIELRGEVTEDDNVAISVLSGTQPIALPRMGTGQSVKLLIDKQEGQVARAQVDKSAIDASIARYTFE